MSAPNLMAFITPPVRREDPAGVAYWGDLQGGSCLSLAYLISIVHAWRKILGPQVSELKFHRAAQDHLELITRHTLNRQTIRGTVHSSRECCSCDIWNLTQSEVVQIGSHYDPERVTTPEACKFHRHQNVYAARCSGLKETKIGNVAGHLGIYEGKGRSVAVAKIFTCLKNRRRQVAFRANRKGEDSNWEKELKGHQSE